MTQGTSHQPPIAVVGMSALFPSSPTGGSFWRNIIAGRDLLTEIPPEYWLVDDFYDTNPSAPDKTYSKRGGFLPPVEFDPLEFGIPPSSLAATDSSQLLSLMVAKRVLLQVCGGDLSKLKKDRASVILGFTAAAESVNALVSRLQRPIWVKALRESGIAEPEVDAICDRIAKSYVPWQEASFPGLLGNVVAGRIANRLDLHGTNVVVDAACASALAAVQVGVNELAMGQADLVLAGGVDANNDIFVYMCFSKTPALSPTDDNRPFSAKADGMMVGEGIAMFALKRLADAERDGDHIYGVLRGSGSGSDGRSKSIYAPLPEGQARALRRAYEAAGYGPETVELMEAHGTGTKAGDLAEFEGLSRVFAPTKTQAKPWCALGSVKSQIGHTKGAAGAAGLFKAVMALNEKVLPPTIKVERPNPALNIEASPFYLNTVTRPWIRDASHPRRAAVSSFGFGGTNFHLTVEEYVPSGAGKAALRHRTAPTELVLLHADAARALVDRCKAVDTTGDLERIARETQLSFDAAAPVRLAIIAESGDDLAAKLAQAMKQLAGPEPKTLATPNGIYLSTEAPLAGSVAFLFPGQGSQYVGMGGDLAMAFDAARRVWDESATLRFDGAAIHEAAFPVPVFGDAARLAQEERLRATEWAQPAIGLASLATLAVLRNVGLAPTSAAGHSFGELTSLHAAGVFGTDDFVRLARRRGELMRDAASSTPGAMLAIVDRIENVETLLRTEGADAVIANHNGPEEVVVSGSPEAIDALERVYEGRKITTRRLAVATAFHSPLVAAAAPGFAKTLEDVALAPPTFDVYGNTDAAPYGSEPRELRTKLAQQIASPVRFVDVIEAMHARGVRAFVEVGPGAVLTGLVERILGKRDYVAVPTDRKGRHGVTSLQHALGRLAAAGQSLNFAYLWDGYVPPDPPRSTSGGKTVALRGTNYGKPYPPVGGSGALPRPNPPVAKEAPRPHLAPPVAASPALEAVAAAPPPGIVQTTASTPMNGATKHAPSATMPAGWLEAYQEAQRQTAETHAAVQRAMADSHAAFLKAAEASFTTLTAMLQRSDPDAAVVPATRPVSFEPARWAPQAPRHAEPPQAMSVHDGTSSANGESGTNGKSGTNGSRTHVDPVTSASASIPVVHAPAAPVVPAIDPRQLLLSVVAEKTGYETAMLTMEMELEGDLGIDSIKRVEIFAALRDRVPSLPKVNPADLAALKTLGQVVEFMRQAAPPAPDTASGPAAVSGVVPVDGRALLLSVVAEKTGYETAMLTMEMELEGDLGIDSIKRVEIFAALRDRVPNLPKVNPADLAALKTLGQVVEFIERAVPVLPASPTPPRAEKASPAASASTREIVRPVVTRAPGSPLARLGAGRRTVITDDGGGVADALVLELARRGIQAERVPSVPKDADAVIFLGGLREVTDEEDALAINREAFQAARAVASRFETEPGLFVTVQDTGGDFGHSGTDERRAWLGGVAALARTAHHEWRDVSIKAIDCTRGNRSPEAIARAIADELFEGGDAIDVGLREDSRITLEWTVAPLPPGGPSRITSESVIVASGGARGVTAASLIELARLRQPRIALLGRTALREEPAFCREATDETALRRVLQEEAQRTGGPLGVKEIRTQAREILATREIRATLAALEQAGSKARYWAVDVQDHAAVFRVVAEVRAEWGPVTALVHGAGVLADKLIAHQTDEQFELVFGTKVTGLRALLAATAEDPLSWLCLFSSFSAHAGNSGQCTYAMANEVLNQVAMAERARRGERCLVRSVGWGPWEGGMVTPGLARHFKTMGVPLIAVLEGARAFAAEAGGDGGEIVVSVGAGAAREMLLKAASGTT